MGLLLQWETVTKSVCNCLLLAQAVDEDKEEVVTSHGARGRRSIQSEEDFNEIKQMLLMPVNFVRFCRFEISDIQRFSIAHYQAALGSFFSRLRQYCLSSAQRNTDSAA